MKESKLKTSKGITLIALIITIIVLLILAVVSIKLLIDQGIITRSQNATKQYTVEEEKEKITLAYSDYKLAKVENGKGTLTIPDATIDGNETNGWTIIFDKTGNQYTLSGEGKVETALSTEEQLDLLKKYFLGENGETKLLSDIVNIVTEDYVTKIESFKDIEGAVIPDGSIKFKVIKELNRKPVDGILIFSYNEKVYKLQWNMNTKENQTLELVYEPTGREGQKVKYSIDGRTENEKEWTILYDYGDSIEIISPDAIGMLSLGYEDTTIQNPGDVDKDGEANTSIDQIIYSYNTALTRINAYASSQVTNSNKISVRSVGSNPTNPESESGMYKSERLSQWADGRYNEIGKDKDNNAEQDIIRMSYWGVVATGKYYWLASREVNDLYDSDIFFDVRKVMDNGELYNEWFFIMREYGPSWNSFCRWSNAVRPVVKINY